MDEPIDIATLWGELDVGNDKAVAELVVSLYSELRRLASHYLQRERREHTLQTTALVHEAYLRLADQRQVHWKNKEQFLGIAAQVMRRILVDHSRGHDAKKRGKGFEKVFLEEAVCVSPEKAADVVALDEALSRLAEFDPDQARLVELRFFGQQASTIEREIGEKNLYASSLTQIGRVFRQQAKADEAQRAYRESLSLEEELGNRSDAAETRVALAELGCDSGKATEAEQLSRQAVEAFRASAYADEEIAAQAMLSKALLQQGRTDEARATIAEAIRLSKKSQDVTVQIPLILDHADVMAAEKSLERAEKAAQQALTRARNLGLIRLQLEASLTLGRTELRTKNSAAAHARLQALEKSARARGFELIARQAAQANGTS